LGEVNESLARLLLSAKVSPYTLVNSDNWVVDYYVVPSTDWRYLGGEGVTDYLLERSAFLTGNPASSGVFRDEFSEILGTNWLIDDGSFVRVLFTIVWMVCAVIIAFMFLKDAKIINLKV
jgi:hypothetical protein